MKTEKKKLHVQHTGFHGITDATIMVDPARIVADDHYTYIPVSHRVAGRINQLCCGMDDCRCGECMAQVPDYGTPEIIVCMATGRVDLEHGEVEMTGCYPTC